MTTPTVKTGFASGVTLVQSGSIHSSTGTSPSASLSTASTAGTTLIAVLAYDVAVGVLSIPAGWILVDTSVSVTAYIYVFGLFGNPGGITSVTIPLDGSAPALMHLSEWSGPGTVVGQIGSGQIGYLNPVPDASGYGDATAISGTTLTPTTPNNVATGGDLAIACWIQEVSTSETATFTTPSGWTRLVDSGTTSGTWHLDVEYKIGPSTGSTLGPVLTSNRTSTAAAGFVVVLTPGGSQADQSDYVEFGSFSAKLNTFDFNLVDPATAPQLNDPVAITSPTWAGRIVSVTQSELVDRASGHVRYTVSAINSDDQATGTAPELSDDGSAGTYPYENLSIQQSQANDGSVVTHGQVTAFESGFVPGYTFYLTSSNFGITHALYQVTNVTQTIWGLDTLAYMVEFSLFGETYPRLQAGASGALAWVGS